MSFGFGFKQFLIDSRLFTNMRYVGLIGTETL